MQRFNASADTSISSSLAFPRSQAPKLSDVEAMHFFVDVPPSDRHYTEDVEAFEELYEMHRDFVFAVSKRFLEDTVDAEDVVQSVFISVWRRPDAFRGGSIRAWLTTVTKNRARDVLRSRMAARETMLPDGLVDVSSFPDDILERLEYSRVISALATLPCAQRLLIVQGFLAGRTHGELALQTGLPLGTVKTRIRAGLHALRKTLVA